MTKPDFKDRQMTLMRQIVILAVVSVLLGLGARVVQKQPVPFWGFPKPIELIQPKVAFAGADLVSPDSAFVAADKAYDVDFSAAMGLYMKRKKASIHIVDAREPKLYEEGHIPGAQNIPYEKVADYQDSVNKLPKTDLILLYCDGGDCHLSHDLAEYLQSLGYRRLAVYTGGWAEWSKETDFIEKKE
jgi:rhodanese-related sulfurtransferase